MDLNELKQDKHAAWKRTHELLSTAEREKRAMTSDEDKEYRMLENRMIDLNGQIIEAEAVVAREAEAARRAFEAGQQYAGNGKPGPFLGSQYNYAGSDVETGDVLRPDQSVRSYMQSRGLIRQPEFDKLSFGAFLRSMVTGAKNDMEKRALSEGTDSAGGYSVPDIVLSRFIDKLRSATVTIRAGAQTVPLTSDKTTVVRIASDPAAAWRNENSAITVVDGTYEGVVFAPKSLAVMVKVSRELLEDSLNIERMLEASFAGAMAVELDRVALVGSGVAPQPLGISGTANVGAVAAGGALTSYDKIMDAVYEILVDNGAMPTAMVMPPRTIVALSKLKTGLSSDNTPLQKPALIANIPMLSTTSLPITESPGTASRIIMGDFSRLMIGVRSALRVEVLRELYAGDHQYGYCAHLRADIAVEHPESFAQITGIVP